MAQLYYRHRAMQLSFSSVVIGLVAGTAIGFIASIAMQNQTDESAPSIEANQSSKYQPSVNDKKSSPTVDSSNVQSSSAAPENTIVPNTEALDFDQLLNRKRYAGGFSAELAIMNEVGRADFDELQSLAIKLLNQPQQRFSNNALQLISLRMIELDRDGTMRFLIDNFSSSSASRSVYEVHSMIEALATTHYQELIAWSDNLPDKQTAHTIRSQVLSGLARVKPEEAVALYSKYDNGSQGEHLYSFLGSWAEVDPQAAMAWALDQPKVEHDMHASEIVFSEWLMSDYNSAKAFLQSIGDEEIKARLELALINEMSVQDPQSAIELALALEDHSSRTQALESAFYGWSSSSLMDAIDYATHSLSGADQDAAFHIIGMSAGGPGQLGGTAYETMVMTESMPQTLRERIRMNTMYSFFEEDPQAAMQWLDTVADPIEHEQLLSTIAYDMARTDLALAQSLFDQSNESIQQMLGDGIAHELHSSNPESAWSWYEQLPVGHVKSSVLQSMIFREAETNPENAMQLALNIPGIESEEMMFSVFASAAATNHQWASDWLDQADISQEKAMELRTLLEEFRFGAYGRYEY